MNRARFVLVALVVLAAGAAFANRFGYLLTVLGGMQVGTASTVGTAANKVSTMLGGSATIDFAVSDGGCADSSAITVTGAAAGDPCMVGAPTAITNHASVTCFVSAADAVKVRACYPVAGVDPASGTFYVRTISSQ